jgi:uncharacterized protein (DUF433 family)
MRLPRASGKRLERMARRHGWTISDTSARLVEEGLRCSEFPFIDFRDSSVGRQAYIQGSRLPVWQVLMLARGYKGDVKLIAKHLDWPEIKVRAALNYAEVFSKEINTALKENDEMRKNLKRLLPQLEEFCVKD